MLMSKLLKTAIFSVLFETNINLVGCHNVLRTVHSDSSPFLKIF